MFPPYLLFAINLPIDKDYDEFINALAIILWLYYLHTKKQYILSYIEVLKIPGNRKSIIHLNKS